MKRLHHTIFYILVLLVSVSCTHRADTGVKSAGGGSSVSELREAGLQALNQSDYRQAIKIGRQLLDPRRYDQKANGSEAAIYGRIILAQGEMIVDSMRNVCRYLLEAEKLCKEEQNDSALASVYNGLGIYYNYSLGDTDMALKTYFEGLEIAKRVNSERMQSILMVNISVIYHNTHDPNALRYALECYYKGKKIGNGRLQYMGAVTTAREYIRNKEYKQGQKYLEEAEILMHANAMRDEACIYTNYGLLYWHTGDYEKAKLYFEDAINNNIGLNYEYLPYLYLANIYSKEGDIKKAEQLLKSCYAIIVKNKNKRFQVEILNSLASLYEQHGRPREGVALRRQVAELKLQMSLASKDKMIEQLRYRNDLERAENEIARHEDEVHKKQMLLWLLVGIILIVAGCSVGFYVLYRRKSRLYAAIVRQAAEGARQEEILRRTIKGLEEKYLPEVEAPEVTEGEGEVPTGEHIDDNDRILFELQARFEALMADPAVYADKEISKEKVARLLSTNRTYVSRMVNRIYGVNFPAYVNSLRIKEAIRVLSDPANSIPLKTLADDLGYSSMTTFYAKFKEETGMTPAVFRQKARSI